MSSDVAVTGIGVVSPLGVGHERFWQRLCAGESGIVPASAPDGERAAARLVDFSPRDLIHSSHLRRMDDASRMVAGAAALGLKDAGIAGDDARDAHFGVVVGSAFGDINDTLEYLTRLANKGPSLVSPMMFPNLVLNAPASYTALEVGCTGANFTVAQGEISGELAISLGCDLIRGGRADIVLAGGGDQLGNIIWSTYRELRALAGQRGGDEWCSPYDVDRNGLVLGEGAAILVLESPEHAQRRGARTYAVIEKDIGFGVPSSLYEWPTAASSASGIIRERLGDDAARFDLVLGSANSSRGLDGFEVETLTRLFGEAAAAVSVTSIKGAIGEFGAAGALTAAAAVLALRDGVVPPLCNLRRPITTALQFAGATGEQRPLKRALQLSAARGGGMAAIVYRSASR